MTRFGVVLPTFDPYRTAASVQVLQAARLAESLGFDAVWAGDHLACPAPVLDAPTCLGAVAAVTERIAVGLSVMLIGLRPVAWAAKQLATLDALSAGRLALGVGVGGEFPAEFTAAGVSVSERGARLDDSLAVLGDLLTGKAVDYDGRSLRLRIPALEPPMCAPPPLLVGGRSDHALQRAAQFGDTWLPMWLAPEAIVEQGERLGELAASHGRPRPGLAVVVSGHVDDDTGRGRREAAEHLHGLYGLPLETVKRWTPIGGISCIAERLDEYISVGVDEFVLMPLARDPLRQYERLAEATQSLTRSAKTTAPASA